MKDFKYIDGKKIEVEFDKCCTFQNISPFFDQKMNEYDSGCEDEYPHYLIYYGQI